MTLNTAASSAIGPYPGTTYDFDFAPARQWFTTPTASPTVTVQVLIGENASVAQVYFGGITATGEAKRNKGERKNNSVASDLAVGRALENLGRRLVARANKTLGD